MTDYVLIGTEGCHLCEQAEQMLREAGLLFSIAEIMDHPQWQDKFAVKIPVLLHQDTGEWLAWPFDSSQINSI